jgi:hypothetical protein
VDTATASSLPACIPGLLGRADYTRLRLLYGRPSPANPWIYPMVTRPRNDACAASACTAICVPLGNMWCTGYKHAHRSHNPQSISTSRLTPEIWNKVRGLVFPPLATHPGASAWRYCDRSADPVRAMICTFVVLGNFPLADRLLHDDAIKWGF